MVPRERRSAGRDAERAGEPEAGRARTDRFFLAAPPASGSKQVALATADAEHARVVLRLGPGDRCVGLDGAGSAWPLVVTASGKRGIEVEVAGEVVREPAPGEAGAPLPWIEVAVAMPRGARAESMVDALTQLGVAAITPLLARRSPPPARSEGDHKRERLVRIAREACKQSGRSWMVELREAIDVARFARRDESHLIRLDPRASADLSTRIDAFGRRDFTRARPLVLVIGPEGGFAPDEEALLDAAGSRPAAIAPHILRIETAAAAAVAIVVERLKH
jgi:16S rRNA (uracil1498-N3)-methyltransferase